MGRRKLFTSPLSLVLTFVTLLFLVSFAFGQAPPAAPAAPAAPPATVPKTVTKTKTKKKAPAKTKNAKAKTAKDPKAKDAKAKNTKANNAKDAGAKNKALPPPPAPVKPPSGIPPPPATPPPVTPPPATPPPATPPQAPTDTNTVDPNLAKECTDCWNNKRSELSACKGVTNDEFIGFNKDPSSARVASCYCMFANNIKSILDDSCSAVCVDQKVIDDITSQADQFKTSYKCDDKGNTILGSSSSNLVSGNQTSSAIPNNINGNNMYLGLSFVVGVISFLIFI